MVPSPKLFEKKISFLFFCGNKTSLLSQDVQLWVEAEGLQAHMTSGRWNFAVHSS